MKKRNTNPYQILSVESDAKTVKGNAQGYLTAILYLAPHTIASEKSLCPFSTAGCRADCLFTAGRGAFAQVQQARIARTKLFLHDPKAFKAYVRNDIKKLVRIARKRGLIPAVRLNGTSDIIWERFFPEIFHEFSDVQFYDYTKIPVSYRTNRPFNYHLTFSLSESNQKDALDALKAGINVTAVFPSDNFPSTYLGFPVINGDESDLRFLDAPHSIVGLKAKGKARADHHSGFVLQ